MQTMDQESPASPGESPASPDMESAAPTAEQLHDLMEVDSEDDIENSVAVVSAKLPSVRSEQSTIVKRGYKTPEWNEKYTAIRTMYESFQRISSLGDVSSIYRSRPLWITYVASDLIEPATRMVDRIPSARAAFLNYAGLLIHENAHLFFTAKENPQLAVDFSSVQNAALALLKEAERFIPDVDEESTNVESARELLAWCCTLASEICLKNGLRPCTNKLPRAPKPLLDLFTSVPSIKELVSLIDLTVTYLLTVSPDECMTVLFDASRYGADFDWIWVHIAITFPGSIVEHLFVVGADQFKAYVDDIQQKSKMPPTVLNQIHDEYNLRFKSLSDVFVFLTCCGNIELKNVVTTMLKESLDAEAKPPSSNLNIIFYFKLVTCSVETLRFLVDQNSDLATPLNFYRGMRQILSVDKRLILTSLSYAEFGRQMINGLDVKSRGVILSAMARIAFDPAIFSALEQKEPAVCKTIKAAALFAVDELVHLMVRDAHTVEAMNVVDYPAIEVFSCGTQLQFLIDASNTNPEWSPVIIRCLHSIAICFGETKSGEIAARLLISCKEVPLLSILIAFLTCTTPFHPKLLEFAYRDLLAVRSTYKEEKLGVVDDVQLLLNLQTLWDWEVSSEDTNQLKFFGVNPGEHFGHLLCGLLSIAIENTSQAIQSNYTTGALSVLSAISRLLSSTTPNGRVDKSKPAASVPPPRHVMMLVRHSYKVSLQLAALLRLSLATVSSDVQSSISVFEVFRVAICEFYTVHCDSSKENYSQEFLASFVTDCLLKNESLFGERIQLDQWRDPLLDKAPDVGDENYSFLKALDAMAIKKKVVQLAHSGVIGKGARRKNTEDEITDDQYLRRHVFVDSVRTMCVSGCLGKSLSLARRMATIVVDMICQDAIGSDILFAEWECEKDSISRYLGICQRLEASPVSNGLIEVLTEVPGCTWFALAIVKAHLAACLNRFDSAIDKMSVPSDSMVDQLDAFVYLARRGDVLPARFEHILDMVPQISCYEGFLLLLEIWRYYQRCAITYQMIDQVTDQTLAGTQTKPLLQDPSEQSFDIYRLVIQRNIIRLGYLYPVIFAKDVQDLSCEIEEPGMIS